MIVDCVGFNLCNPAVHWIVYRSMNKKESRRIVPLSVVAIAAFAVLIVCQVLVIGGVFELKASTVARIAPWAYEPFLRLVGEHPESQTLKDSAGEQAGQGTDALSGMASIAGLDPDGVSIDAAAQDEGTDDAGSGELLPAGSESNAVPAGSLQTNAVPDQTGDAVPVG